MKRPASSPAFSYSGAASRTRTCGLLIRSQTLYPTELWLHNHKRGFGLGTLIFETVPFESTVSIEIKDQRSKPQDHASFRWWRRSTLKLLTNEANHFRNLLRSHFILERRHAVAAFFDLLHKVRIWMTQGVSFAQARYS
jgi:hypothetical protein